jgi:hypothetical protein
LNSRKKRTPIQSRSQSVNHCLIICRALNNYYQLVMPAPAAVARCANSDAIQQMSWNTSPVVLS